MVLEYNEKMQCKKCGKQYINVMCKWCKPCQMDFLKANFTSWTSGNEKIDEFIQEMQLKIDDYDDIIFEWIPYNQFSVIKEISKCGFSTVCLAIWKDGPLLYNGYSRIMMGIVVALKRLNNTKNITDFLNEV